MKPLFIVVVLCASLVFGKDPTFSHVSGRSGDILLKSRQQTDNSVVYLLNSDTNMNTIDDQSYADLVSHLLGGPVINTEASREAFPKSSLFDKTTANVLFVVDTVDSAHFDDLKMIKNGSPIKLQQTSYPQDNIATMATLSAGVSPSVHGITGSSWASYLGQIQAYKAGALPSVQNLADSFSQTFGGKSLIFSAGSDFQMTSAFGVNQFVHYPFNNEVALFFNMNTRKLESLYASSLEIESILLSASNITQTLLVAPLALPGAQDTMVFDETYSEYTINLKSKSLEATFAATDLTVFSAELLTVRNVNNLLKNDAQFKAMVSDAFPDLFTFSFASLRGIERKYGRDSEQYKICIYLLDEAIAAATESFTTTYSKKVSTQIVFLGKSAVEQLAEDRQAKHEVYNVIRQSVQKSVFDNNFPSIYLSAKADREMACDALKSTEFDVYCAEPSIMDEINFPERFPDPSNQTVNGTKDAAIFQISLWSPILLGLALIAVIIAFCTMDVGGDSMIYRSTNLRMHPHSN